MNGRERGWVALFSFAVGFVLVLPFLLMPLQRGFYKTRFPVEAAAWPLNGSFSALESFHMDVDVYPYAARMRQAGEHLLAGDPHIKENRSRRLIVREFLSFEVLGLFYRLAGSPSRAWVLAQFVLSALWVPVLFWLFLEAGCERGPALAASVALTLFNDLTRLPMTTDLRVLLGSAAQYSLWPLGSYNYWFGPTRMTRPLLTYPLLFIAAVLGARLGVARGRKEVVAAGLVGGALAYVHPDVWAVYVAATALFAAWLSWKRRAPAFGVLASLALTLALSIPWLWLSFAGGEDSPLTGGLWARGPDLKGLLYAAAAILAFRDRRSSPLMLWMGCLLLGVALLLNAHLIIGVQGANTSLWWYLGNTSAAIVVGKRVVDALRLSPSSWRWLAACIVLAALPRAFGYSSQHYRLYALPAEEEQALRWLETNARPESVVAALSPMTVFRVPIYTRCKTLTSMIFPLTSDISFRENARRIHEALGLFGVSPQAFVAQAFDASSRWDRRLWSGEVDVQGHDRSGQAARYFLDAFDPGRFSRLLEEAAHDERGDFTDYLWVGPFERALMPGGKPPRLSGAAEVFSNGTVTIYALGPSASIRRP